MSNILNNGAVLPSGLLGADSNYDFSGFNKSYKNYPLRMGVITACYPIGSENNRSKLTNEYDVSVFEQHEDLGTTVITYKNCLCSEGLGSIADFFEKTLRVKEDSNSKKDVPNTKHQNGAVVLLMCLDGVSDKGIILGALTHPDRKSTITDEGPRMEGEFNGMNLKVEKDGSAKITFKGATDNNGKIIDESQGDTVIDIEKDGTFQVSHENITQRLEKSGNASLTAKKDISNTTEENFNISAKKNIVMKADKDSHWDTTKFTLNANGSANIFCNGLNVESQATMSMNGKSLKVDAASMAMIKSPSITLDGQVALGGAGGLPVLILSTQMIGIGNLGAPVMSTAIFGFANKVTGK